MMTDDEIASAIADLRALTAGDLRWVERDGGKSLETDDVPGFDVSIRVVDDNVELRIEDESGLAGWVGPNDGRDVNARARLAGNVYELFVLARSRAKTGQSARWGQAVAKRKAEEQPRGAY